VSNKPINHPVNANADHLLIGIKVTARKTLTESAAALLDFVNKQLDATLNNLNTKNTRDLSNLAREMTVHRFSLEAGLHSAVTYVLDHPASIRTSGQQDATDPDELEIMGEDLVEAQLALTRTSHTISQALEWGLADLNTRVSYLSRIEGVDAALNPINPDALSRMLHRWVDQSLLAPESRGLFKQMVQGEFAALAAALYHELNAWLIREGVLPKIDLRALVLLTAGSDRWKQLTAQSLLDYQQPALEQAHGESTLDSGFMSNQQSSIPSRHSSYGGPGGAGGSGGGYGSSGGSGSPLSRPGVLGGRTGFPDTTAMMSPPMLYGYGAEFNSTGLLSIKPVSTHTLASEMEALSKLGIPVERGSAGVWSKLKSAVSGRFGANLDQRSSQGRAGAPSVFGTSQLHGGPGGGAQFDATIMQLLDHVETQLLSTMPSGEMRGALDAKSVASLPRLVQFREEMQAAASSANERATIELVALMFDHILTDETIPSLARILFARLQIPVLRVAIRENEAFMESTHPARDFIDRVGSVLAGYSGEEKIDARLQAEVRRLVMAAEKASALTGVFFSRLLYDFELFLERYGRDLREISVLGVPMLEQTEDYKVSAVLYTIELRKLTDDIPCDKRVRDFLLHSWVSVMSSVGSRHGKESAQVKQGLRLAADLVWCGVPKVTLPERTELVSTLPDLMKRVEASLADAGATVDAQKKASTRLRSTMLQIIRSPANQAPVVVFDTLLAKLQQFEQAMIEAGERSPNYRIPLATLRSQISSRALSLHVIEPTDLRLDAALVASPAAHEWAHSLKLGSWYRAEIVKGRAQLLQLAWLSPYRNYLLFSEPQGTAGMISEPNTVALMAERGMFKPVEIETVTERATRGVLQKATQ
jgi:Protein of unknown function (DUF1631)